MGGMHMIHWAFALVAFVSGTIFGMMLAALLVVQGGKDDEHR